MWLSLIFKRITHFFSLLFYRLVAMRLPHSFWPAGFVFSFIRKAALRGMGCKVGECCDLEPGIDVGFNPDIVIGNHCQINQNTSIKTARIGNDVMIAPGVVLLDRKHNFSRTDLPMAQQGSTAREITNICDDVWLGQNVVVMPGVKIGRGSVIGAGSIVTKDLPDFSVAVGTPARIIRFREKSYEN